MTQPAPATTEFPTCLEELLAAELALCTALGEAGQAARAAFAAGDAAAVETAVQQRGELLESLAALEREASPLRHQHARLATALEPGARWLRGLARDLAAEELELNQLAAAAVAQLKQRLQGVQAGAKGLRGYRGSVTVGPRFSDRRG